MSSGQIHIYYPRGFRRLQHGDMPTNLQNDHSVLNADGHQVVYSNGDAEVTELYRRWRSSEDTASWAYVETVLTCAKRLMPDLTSFFYFQGKNARLHGWGFDFLCEVINYIARGSSMMTQPLSALELLDDYPERNAAATHNRVVPQPPRNAGPNDALVFWLMHRSGFEHLVETLFVFFGPARVEKEAELPVRTLSERRLTKGWMKISSE